MRQQYVTPFNPQTKQATDVSVPIGCITPERAISYMGGIKPDLVTKNTMIYYLTDTTALCVSWIRFKQ